MTMKKLCSVLLVCVVLAMVFATAALAETTVGSGSKNIYGSGTLTITASQAPRYIYVTISNCSGASYGIITVKKPNGTSYSIFWNLMVMFLIKRLECIIQFQKIMTLM